MDWLDGYHAEYEKFTQGKSSKLFDYFADDIQFIWQGTVFTSNKDELKALLEDFRRRTRPSFQVSCDNKVVGKNYASAKFHNFMQLEGTGCENESYKIHGYTACVINDDMKATHCQAWCENLEQIDEAFQKSDKCLGKKSDL